MIKVAIIGCGLIGQKRAKFLSDAQLIACADQQIQKAELLAKPFSNCAFTSNWQDVIKNPEVNLVIIATPHNSLAEISIAAINAGKHVMLEKPGARSAEELKHIIHAAKKNNVLVRVGFNHRYHRTFRQAKNLIHELGELMFIRARYGHGGRIGYDKEWRAISEISGGGELIDQGVHLIDLARWFLGEFTDVHGSVHTYFWDMEVDDNSFLILKTAKNQTAFLHASCTEWKNLFSFEIYGKNGKLEINGLGGSYGVERLTFYKMLPTMGPPETTSWEYPMVDDSWEIEFQEFLEDIRLKRQPSAGLLDAYAALDVVGKIYCHPEQREGSPYKAQEPVMEIPRNARNDSVAQDDNGGIL